MLLPLRASVKKIARTIFKDRTEVDPIVEEEFGHIYQKVKPYTMVSKERLYALFQAVRYIIKNDIPGDFVECGVWRGGCAMVIAYALEELGVHDRKIFLYDTYEGMSKPTEDDFNIKSKSAALPAWESKRNSDDPRWCYASLEDVESNMRTTGYPESNLVFVKGKVEETIPQTIPQKIALLRLDTDWYESTAHELKYLYPLVSSKGVLLIDDYGHWAGAKKAVDEYFADAPMLLHRTDYTGRSAVKP